MDSPTVSYPDQDAAPESASTTPPTPQLLEVGQIIASRYRVEEVLGQGAFGRVYRATHTMMKTSVAIKTLVSDVHDLEEARARFLREAQAAGAMDHPHICRVTDFGELQDGSFFMVMEYLNGRTLEKEIQRRGVLRVDESIDILVQVCRALERAHEMGIVHRDLKPENIMLLEREGNPAYVKILDFGIALAQSNEKVNFSNEKLTRVGTVCGTPHYMSPEQVVGDEIDARSDLYSLGIIFYEMLCGRVPFESDKLTALMMMQLTELHPNIQTAAPQPIPDAIKAIVDKLLHKDSQQRFQSAAHLKEALINARAALPNFDPARFATMTSMSSLSTELPISTAIVPAHGGAPLSVSSGASTFAQLDAIKQKLPPALAALPTTALVFSAAALMGMIFLSVIIIAVLVSSGGKTSQKNASPENILPAAHADASAKAPEGKKVQQEIQLDLEESRLSFKKDPKVSLVLEELIMGNVDSGIKKLEALESELKDQSHYHYFLGAAYAQKKDWNKSMSAYAQAIVADLRYAGDKDFLSHLEDCFDAKNCDEGVKSLQTTLETSEKSKQMWLRILSKKALDPATKRGQRRAAKLLQEDASFSALPQWEQSAIKLVDAKGCKERVSLIGALGEAKDERSLPVLQQLSKLPKRGCGFLRRDDCHSCIRSPLRKAIAAIKNKDEKDLSPEDTGESADAEK